MRTRAPILAIFLFSLGVITGGYSIPVIKEHISAKLVASQPVSQPANLFLIKTRKKSYFALDGDGNLIAEQRGSHSYYKIKEGEYFFQRQISSKKTALIVMDPWEDNGDEHLNKHFEPILKNKILPMVFKAIALDILVVVLTNDPKKIDVSYGGKVHPELEALVRKNKIQMLYHQDLDEQRFAEYLKKFSIDTLIYSGFASNMCVIGRATGMIPMATKEFRLFFVPEASAAVEFKDSWQSNDIHSAMTSMISQWVAEIIDLDDFMQIVPAKHLLVD